MKAIITLCKSSRTIFSIPCMNPMITRRIFFPNRIHRYMSAPTEELNELTLGEDGQPLTKSQIKKLEKQREKERKKAEVAARLVNGILIIGCRKGC